MAMLVAGCTSTLPDNLERAMLETAEGPKPTCESGHDAALNGGVITISPGQVVCVQLRIEGDTIVPVSIVSAANPETTLVLRSWIDAESSDTFLTLHNPLDLLLRYEASMLRADASQAEYTSSCPVLSRRVSIEHWPYPIQELRIGKFSVEPEMVGDDPKTQTIRCR
jgi:hypothetical protein